MTATLFRGDALAAARVLADRGVALDLVYVDPPFGVGAKHGARTRAGEARSDRTSVAYDDAWTGIDAFLASLEPRLAAIRDVLSPRGTLYLHLDHRTVHEAKVLCDRVFSRAAFRGEIVWVPGNGTRTTRSWGASHQTLLVYTRDDRPSPDKPAWIFHHDDPLLREPFAETSRSRHFSRGYRERTVVLASGPKTYRYEASAGRRLGTVWTDAPSMAANTPLSPETTGYPHQKPERLLERLIAASSDEGSAVGDFFCGSGTTVAVAVRRGRVAYGADTSELAIETTQQRLRARGVEPIVEVLATACDRRGP